MTTLTILSEIYVFLCICSGCNNIYFHPSLSKSRVKWDGSRNSTQKMRIIATGWGDTRNGDIFSIFGGQKSNVLLEVRVEIWSNAECSNQYKKIGDTILDTMLCAGSPGRDTCQVKIYVGQPIPIFRKTYSLI